MTGRPIDGAQTAPAVARNRAPILAVLRRILPKQGTMLEIASGTGEHAVYFAAALPDLTWQPTDRDAAALRSISAHCAMAKLPNLLPPLELDVCATAWPTTHADAMIAINLIHIAPRSAAQSLMAGAGRLLARNRLLYLYGPFKEHGRHTAPSNATFDASLRAHNPEWGVRDAGEVAELARRRGLELVERVSMPANNLSLVFQRT